MPGPITESSPRGVQVQTLPTRAELETQGCKFEKIANMLQVTIPESLLCGYAGKINTGKVDFVLKHFGFNLKKHIEHRVTPSSGPLADRLYFFSQREEDARPDFSDHKPIVGLLGLRRSGKDTAALALITNGFQIVKFAGALKQMVRAFLQYVGADSETIERLIEGDLKESPINYFGGRSTRYVMQTIGTEWGREIVHDALWVNACMARCKQFPKVVISDVRFPNEAEAIRKAGGIIIRIERPGTQSDGHASEQPEVIAADAVISNDSTIEQLHEKLLTLIPTTWKQ